MTRAHAMGASHGLRSPVTMKAVLVASVFGTALAYMSDDMLNLAVPSIAGDLRATMSEVQWILNSYYVSLVSSVLLAGSIGDRVGHRRVFLWGIAVFTAGAFGCAVAPAVEVMVAGRFVQGGGAAMMLTGGLALVTRLSPAEDRTRSLGRFFGLVAAVPALGPLASGALVDALSWRWLFVVPLVLPLAAVALTWLFVPETARDLSRAPDTPGAALGFLTLASLSVGLIVGAADFTAAVPLATLGAAGIFALGFVAAERRASSPMVPGRLLRRRVFVGGNLIWLLGCLTSWGAVFFVAVMLQSTLGLRPLLAGLTLTPIYLVMMIGSPLMAVAVAHIGHRWPIMGGLFLYAIGLAWLSRIGPSASILAEVLPALLVFALGMAIFTTPLAAATLGAVDDHDQGVASGFHNAMGQLAGLLAIVILPAAAGLAGVELTDPEFALGYSRALTVSSLIAFGALMIAAATLRPWIRRARESSLPMTVSRAKRETTP